MNLSYEIEDNIGVITLSGPRYNLLQDPVFAEAQELLEFLQTPTLKAVIVQGQGRHFSAGADPASLERQINSPEFSLKERLNRGKKLLDLFSYAKIPTLALIRGSCLGAGLEIALACHFRFAATNAVLGFPEVDHLLLPGLGGTVATPRLLSLPKAIDLILSGRLVGADEALEMGLVDQTARSSELAKVAKDYLGTLTSGRSETLIHAVMEAIHGSRKFARPIAFEKETDLFCALAQRRSAKQSDV